MIERVTNWFLLVGIVMAASACDNVSWGGIQVGLRSPSDDTTATGSDTVQALLQPPPELSMGPLLFSGVRNGDLATIQPVAEMTEDGLRPIPTGSDDGELDRRILETRLRPGAQVTLFHQGVRIGTLAIEESRIADSPYCGSRSQATGHLQLVPEAAQVQRFLALEEAHGRDFGFEPYRELSSVYDQRVASLNMGTEAIPLVGAAWPPSLLDIRQDIQVFQLTGRDAPSVMATFVHRDQLQVGPAPANAYSLMVMGEPQGRGLDLSFTWYRPVASQGKGFPRYFSHLDWDRDGEDEILLEVLGTDTRWFATIDGGPDGWAINYQDPCGTPQAQGGEE